VSSVKESELGAHISVALHLRPPAPGLANFNMCGIDPRVSASSSCVTAAAVVAGGSNGGTCSQGSTQLNAIDIRYTFTQMPTRLRSSHPGAWPADIAALLFHT
jgi:hypothetical protein